MCTYLTVGNVFFIEYVIYTCVYVFKTLPPMLWYIRKKDNPEGIKKKRPDKVKKKMLLGMSVKNDVTFYYGSMLLL